MTTFGEAVHNRLTQLDRDGHAYSVLVGMQRCGVLDHGPEHLTLSLERDGVQTGSMVLNLARSPSITIEEL